jgi:hypothetical protein
VTLLFRILMAAAFVVAAVCAEAQTPPLAPGEPFRVLADHDGLQTTSYDLILDGSAVASAPVSALTAGVVTFAVSSGLPAGTHTAAVRAVGTGGTAMSLNTVTFTVGTITTPPPAPPTNVQVIPEPTAPPPPPPPPPGIQDSFDRPDAPTLGANWTNQVALTPRIVNGQAAGNLDNSTRQCAFWNATTVAPDQFSEITVGTLSSSQYAFASVRASGVTSATNSHYAVSARPGASDVYKRVAGNRTPIVTIGSVPWVTGDVLRLEVRGSTLKVFRNGTQIGTDIASGGELMNGQPGACLWSTGTLDDFTAGALQ